MCAALNIVGRNQGLFKKKDGFINHLYTHRPEDFMNL